MRMLSVAVAAIAVFAFSAPVLAECSGQSHSVKAPQEVVQTTPATTPVTSGKQG